MVQCLSKKHNTLGLIPMWGGGGGGENADLKRESSCRKIFVILFTSP